MNSTVLIYSQPAAGWHLTMWLQLWLFARLPNAEHVASAQAIVWAGWDPEVWE